MNRVSQRRLLAFVAVLAFWATTVSSQGLCRICACDPSSDGQVSVCEGDPTSKTKVIIKDKNGGTSQVQVDDSSTSTVTYNNVSAQPVSGKNWGSVQEGDCEDMTIDCSVE